MFKNIMLGGFLMTSLYLTANAQTDTAGYDIGRILVKKDATQTITIKGADLERYQFSNLADAINVWLYGTYTNSSNLVYAVNGNIITDANAYSIYDIDEVTLVQNALANVSGAPPGGQLVLIKLKTNRPGKQGIEAAGQTSLVDRANQSNTPGVKSTVDIYNQYYLSGYKNVDGANFGLSVDYQHDVFPELTTGNFTLVDPFHFNRFKFNGYANARLWKGTTLNFGINYVPQTSRSDYNYNFPNLSPGETSSTDIKDGAVQHMASSTIGLNSHIVKGLTNMLSAAYNHYNSFERDSLHDTQQFPDNPPTNVSGFAKAFQKVSNFLLRDNLVYNKSAGAFNFEPALNFSFRKFTSANSDSTGTLTYFGGSSTPTGIQLSANSSQYAYKLYLLSPSLTVSYDGAVNLQGGFVRVLNSGKDFFPNDALQRSSPFFSTTIDIFKLAGVNNASMKVFGSFSRQNQLLDDGYATLAGPELVSGPVTNNSFFTVSNTNAPGPAIFSDTNPYHQYNNYQAGLTLGLFRNLTFNYNYLNYFSLDYLQAEIPYGANSEETVLLQYYNHVIVNRVGLDYSYNANGLAWQGGLNVAQAKLQFADETGTAHYSTYLNSGHRYSGGFTNRFGYKSWFAGLDILYQFGERPITLVNASPEFVASPSAVPPHINSVSLQSLYIGSAIKIKGLKYAEVFANTRNILQNNSSVITDNRRFYGFGFKADW